MGVELHIAQGGSRACLMYCDDECKSREEMPSAKVVDLKISERCFGGGGVH